MLPAISFTPDANRQVAEAIEWWHRERGAAIELLEQELRRALERIAEHPLIGTRTRSPRLEGVRCVQLPRTRYQLFYRYRSSASVIDVIAFWHTSRSPL